RVLARRLQRDDPLLQLRERLLLARLLEREAQLGAPLQQPRAQSVGIAAQQVFEFRARAVRLGRLARAQLRGQRLRVAEVRLELQLRARLPAIADAHEAAGRDEV